MPPGGSYYDPEDQSAKGFDFTDQSIRKGFIRKVYSILTVCVKFEIYPRNITNNAFFHWRSNLVLLSASSLYSCTTKEPNCGSRDTRKCSGLLWELWSLLSYRWHAAVMFDVKLRWTSSFWHCILSPSRSCSVWPRQISAQKRYVLHI